MAKHYHRLLTQEEHHYLQEAINRIYGKPFEVAILVKANRGDEIDLQLFNDC